MMKADNWKNLEGMLDRRGFLPNATAGRSDETRWFVCVSPQDDAVTTCLRFVFKPKMHVLTAHVGWRHSAAREFCFEALEKDWPRGFAWLKDAGVIGAPCLSMFNLADYMGWKLGGMPVGSASSVYESAEVRLTEVLDQSQWGRQDSAGLLACYADDRLPFRWQASNSAIRLAEVAGLSWFLRADVALFDRCAREHAAVIETDMFSMGKASDWTGALRARLTGSTNAADISSGS